MEYNVSRDKVNRITEVNGASLEQLGEAERAYAKGMQEVILTAYQFRNAYDPHSAEGILNMAVAEVCRNAMDSLIEQAEIQLCEAIMESASEDLTPMVCEDG